MIVIPLSLLAGQQSLLYSAPPASFTATFVSGILIARKVSQRYVLHGTLVGVIAMMIYLGVSLGRPELLAYLLAYVLKVLGGAAGGFVAMKHGASNAARIPDGHIELVKLEKRRSV